MNRIRIERHQSGRGSRFEVWIDQTLFCHTENDEDGFKLMVAVRRLEAIRVLGADFGTRFAT